MLVPTTLGAIVQSGIPQPFSLISIDGKNPRILDFGATDHLTGSSEHFVSYILCVGNEKIRITDGSLAPIVGKGQISLFDKNCSPKFLCLHPSTKWGCRTKNCHLWEVAHSLMLSTSLPYYLWGDVILTPAHLINCMPSYVYFQTLLYCLKESYPSTRLIPNFLGLKLACFLGILCTNEAINASTHLHSVSEESNYMLPLKSTCPTVVTLPDPSSHRHYDRVIIDTEDRIDENEVAAKHTENETKSNNSRNTSKYDPSLDLPITLRKDVSCLVTSTTLKGLSLTIVVNKSFLVSHR
ncbi:TMV resistance protein N [Cucumis melo var. makuwa]|uniref:TMV resistance protein N n=1 Tax=Cucumis melo var. makuwa TaxID=1194695 RepID=A0A5D3CRM8_CUCMM|nr:TMV resistance protein N [Cucumis melo var. makuwa]